MVKRNRGKDYKEAVQNERAKEEADKKAKEYVVSAIQRCAADHVSETTISVVQRDEESAQRFQERRAERRRAAEERKQREEKSSRRGFAFWKK